jgi:hypothetical protein
MIIKHPWQPLHCPRWVVMPCMRYSRYTHDILYRGILNVCTTSEMECPIHLAPTITPCSNSDNSRHLAVAGVHSNSRRNTTQLIQVWAFPKHQGTVAPLKNEFTYCCPMIFGTWVYIYIWSCSQMHLFWDTALSCYLLWQWNFLHILIWYFFACLSIQYGSSWIQVFRICVGETALSHTFVWS